jgi:hypothetical protein
VKKKSEHICCFHLHSLSPHARWTFGVMLEYGRSNLIAESLPKRDSITRSGQNRSWLRSVYKHTVKYSPMYISLIQHSSIDGWIWNICSTHYEPTWYLHFSLSVFPPAELQCVRDSFKLYRQSHAITCVSTNFWRSGRKRSTTSKLVPCAVHRENELCLPVHIID